MTMSQRELWIFEFIGERKERGRKKGRECERVYYWVIILISYGLYLAPNIMLQICHS